MTRRRLVLRSLAHYWRTNLGVALGAAVAAAVLVGSLAVGDSVTGSLRALALERLGNVRLALFTEGRSFRDDLADDVSRTLETPAAPVLAAQGTVAAPDGSFLVHSVQVLGVDKRFWKLANTPENGKDVAPGESLVNERLAARFRGQAGEEIVLRVEKPSALSRDAALSKVSGSSLALRVKVSGVEPDSGFGRFSLRANQVPPYNVFVPLDWLQQRLGTPGRADMILVGESAGGPVTVEHAGKPITVEDADAAVRASLQPADASLDVRALSGRDLVEIRSDRVFIDPPTARAIESVEPGALRVLGYFVNGIVGEATTTPYSIVAGLGRGPSSIIPPDMTDDEILVNQWLADDLGIGPGDEVRLRYFVLGPDRGLEDREHGFRVRSVVPMKGAAVDPDLMPEFPGLSDVENCRDWEPGFAIDLDRIRPKDEDYWDRYRGTPKAFVTLAAARSMWENRFGDLTAFRIPGDASAVSEIGRNVARAIDPASIGLFFLPVRDQALAASTQGTDFGQLFLGFSFFLIVAALLLMTLLFAFGVEQRAEEVGTLLAVGFRPRGVRRLLLAEGLVLAILGGLVGTAFGLLYTRAVLYGLSTVWTGTGGGAFIRFMVTPGTIGAGLAASVIVSIATIWLSIRKQARAPVRELLDLGQESGASILLPTPRRPRAALWLGVGAAIAALAMVIAAASHPGSKNAGLFFGAGSLLLISCLALTRSLLARLARSSSRGLPSLPALGVRNTCRRTGRSLATAALLALGSFLVVAVGANRHDPFEHSEERSSGTGGFALYGESTLPVFKDLNTTAGLEDFGLVPEDLPGVSLVQFRVREGDDASCLNLNRAQVPRLVGVRAQAFAERGAFTFVGRIRDAGDTSAPWRLLNMTFPDGAVPVIGDEPTLVWGLGKSVGDTITYTDGRGAAFPLRVVGILSSSILQGNLVMSEENFRERFPDESGYRLFLVDAPPANAKAVSATLSRAFRDVGLDLVPAGRRLAEFGEVENTYLSIFQALGGLGLLLGSIGLGVVVLRNVLERRGELALLRAVGFERARIERLVLAEHWFLLLLGVAAGVVSGVLAVLPALLSPGAGVPYLSLTLTVAAVVASGALWIFLATVAAIRGPILPALRNE